ncbi:hypothetical protein B484DRAFT_457611 [Ochromonadaceae sp. CCMP2298]|nr:hypothetical protein B484DRAFT_457611 [Ochromonadaceae sp. CCMP2298]
MQSSMEDASSEENMGAPIEESLGAPIEENVSAPIEESVSAPIEESVSAPIEENVSATIEESVSAPIEENMVGAPTEETVGGAPIEENVGGVPIEENVGGAPIEENVGGAPIDENVDAPIEKKRKNRWGSPQGDSEAANPTGDKEEVPKARKSRFGAIAAAPVPSPMAGLAGLLGMHASLSQEVIQQSLIMKLQLQQVNDKLLTVVKDAAVVEEDPNRSPSPPPKYDSSGKRSNTREVRMREALNQERVRLIEGMLKLNPTFQTPLDFIKAKPSRKIYIPRQANPLYNFIGLIIGPRGNTQKQMEGETGAKISIRGKGSSKEGSKGRSNKNADDDDDLHVFVSGETKDSVDRACILVEALLKPIDDSMNEHKQKQLRELALINGTLREDEYCPICGEKGHRQFECPHRSKSFKAAGVKCSICGDLSHPTRDCPMKNEGPTNEGMLDSEYDSFMAELGEGGGGSSSAGAGGATSADGNYCIPSAPRSKAGPTYVAPIIELVPNRKPQQTVIHVTTLMTGNSGTAPLPTASYPSYGGPDGMYNPQPPLPTGGAPPPPPPQQYQQYQQYDQYDQYAQYGGSMYPQYQQQQQQQFQYGGAITGAPMPPLPASAPPLPTLPGPPLPGAPPEPMFAPPEPTYESNELD